MPFNIHISHSYGSVFEKKNKPPPPPIFDDHQGIDFIRIIIDTSIISARQTSDWMSNILAKRGEKNGSKEI